MYKEKAIRILDELLADSSDANLTQEQRYAIAFAINNALLRLPATNPTEVQS